MTAGPVLRVTDRTAPRRAADPGIRSIAEGLRDDAAAGSPRLTGRLAASWRVTPGRVPGAYLLTNDAEYARFVEYGTRNRPASAMLGRAVARRRR